MTEKFRIQGGECLKGEVQIGGAKNSVLKLLAAAILVKGCIPGPNKGLVTIRSAVKAQKKSPKAKTLVNYSASAEAAAE